MASYRIGDDDIAGEDDEVSAEEIGRAVSRVLSRRPQGLLRQRSTGVRTPYGGEVQAQETVTRADLWQEFGLGAVTNALAGPAVLAQQFIQRFKVGRLMLTETTPGANLVNSVLVGMVPQGANLAARPVQAYAFNAVGALVTYTLGEIGQFLTLNLTTVGAAQTISGMAFGSVVRPMM